MKARTKEQTKARTKSSQKLSKDTGGSSQPNSRTVTQGAEPPKVPNIINGMDEVRGQLLSQARTQALALPKVSETSLYDGFCRHWTPAYYVGETQLFHVHDFRGGLRATVFLGGKAGSEKLGPMILASDLIPGDLRRQVVKATESRGVKQIKVNLNTGDDVADLLELARLKYLAVSQVSPQRLAHLN